VTIPLPKYRKTKLFRRENGLFVDRNLPETRGEEKIGSTGCDG
jgi:hypothetical protein